MNRVRLFALIAAVIVCPAGKAAAAEGGLRLTGRALVAVPQDGHEVYLTWRGLDCDVPGERFDIYRSTEAAGDFQKVGASKASTTFRDRPGDGTFHYQVVPVGGSLNGVKSNVAKVTTQARGRDWVEILPAARGKKLQFSERHFADTDGDGEMEFVTYYPQVPSYRGGVSPESYKLQVFELFDNQSPRWTFDTGMGLQDNVTSGDKRADWDYEWTFKPVAWDLDGDFKAEIVTLAKIDGKYQYFVLRDAGDRCEIVAKMDSPIPVGDLQNNSRHFPFFADLGGRNYSFVLQGGTYKYWEMWAYDLVGSDLKLRWHVKSTEPGFKGNRSSSHSVLPIDIDGDGKDEISNGATILDDDGSVMFTANKEFGEDNHIDGQVIDEIDPRNAGLELMIHTEWGDKYAMYSVRTGRLIWEKKAPGKHLQLNIATNVTGGPGLDVLGVWGGHRSTGTFACKSDGADLTYPYPDKPLNGDRWWAMDWDGERGYNTCMNFTRVYGLADRIEYEIDFSDAPDGDVIPWNEHKLNHFWANIDLVGDYREDIPVQMKDGGIRVYVNTETPPAQRRCKWQNRAYQMLQAAGDYRYFVRALNER